MANEVTVPLLPCASIDVIVEFYEALGFLRTYRQTKPNPYVAVRRERWTRRSMSGSRRWRTGT